MKLEPLSSPPVSACSSSCLPGFPSSPMPEFLGGLPQVPGVVVSPPVCSVCLDDLFHLNRDNADRHVYTDQPRIAMLIGCGHVFHEDCIDKWFQHDVNEDEDMYESKSCPICRQGSEDEIFPCKFSFEDDVAEASGVGISKWIHAEDAPVKEILTLARELKELVKYVEAAKDDYIPVESGLNDLKTRIRENIILLLDTSIGTDGSEEAKKRVEELQGFKVKLERLWASTLLKADIREFNEIAQKLITDIDRLTPLADRLSHIDREAKELEESNRTLEAEQIKLRAELESAGEKLQQETRKTKERERARWQEKIDRKNQELAQAQVQQQVLKNSNAQYLAEMAVLQEKLAQATAEKSELAIQLRKEEYSALRNKKKLADAERKLATAQDDCNSMKGRIGLLEKAGQTLESVPDSQSDWETLEVVSEDESKRSSRPVRQPTARVITRSALGARNPFAQTADEAEKTKRNRMHLRSGTNVEVFSVSSSSDDEAQARPLASGPRHKEAPKRKAEAPAANQVTGPKIRKKLMRA